MHWRLVARHLTLPLVRLEFVMRPWPTTATSAARSQRERCAGYYAALGSRQALSPLQQTTWARIGANGTGCMALLVWHLSYYDKSGVRWKSLCRRFLQRRRYAVYVVVSLYGIKGTALRTGRNEKARANGYRSRQQSTL